VSKITRICDQKKKLISKKKIPGYENISDLMSATFEPPVKLIKETSASVGLDVHEIEYNKLSLVFLFAYQSLFLVFVFSSLIYMLCIELSFLI
jgi:hypothetical protein